MSVSPLTLTSVIDAFGLDRPPSPQELAVIETQLDRVSTMMRERAGPPGGLFAVEAHAYYALLEGLAAEPPR